MTAKDLELAVMAHRYLYYVEAAPVISDSVYDELEQWARAACDPTSPVHGIGSSLPSSYLPEIIEYAGKLQQLLTR